MTTTLFPSTMTGGFDVPPLSMHRFTVEEYEELGRLGVLTEDDSVELLEGLIVRKMTKNPLHDATIDLLNSLLSRQLPAGWFVRIQNVLRTADSEPEPDVVIAVGSPGEFRDRHPTGRDVALVVEVAESSLDQDWRKCRIYARAGVPRYWIVDLNAMCLEVFSRPNRTKGEYRDHVRLAPGDEASIELASNRQLKVSLSDFLLSGGR